MALYKNKFFNWLLVFLWIGLIFYLSAQPNLKSPYQYDFLLRKIAHMVEFAILTVLLWRALRGYDISLRKALIMGVILAIFYAAFDETHQLFVAGRQGSVRDVGIDTIGIFLTGGFLWLRNRRW